MKISAQVSNQKGTHEARVITNDRSQHIAIAPKLEGTGSSVNGGELLFLALATCYCNDIYREAARRNIEVRRVDVTVEGEFGGPGEPARSVTYRARVTAQASEEDIRALMRYTDGVAEIQNSLRSGVPVELVEVEAVVV